MWTVNSFRPLPFNNLISSSDFIETGFQVWCWRNEMMLSNVWSYFQDEEEDLSESFKASIGMMGPEAVAATTEIDVVWEKQYEATLKGFPYEKFARKNFKDKQTLNFSKEHIRGPLLAKRHDIDKLVSVSSIFLYLPGFIFYCVVRQIV